MEKTWEIVTFILILGIVSVYSQCPVEVYSNKCNCTRTLLGYEMLCSAYGASVKDFQIVYTPESVLIQCLTDLSLSSFHFNISSEIKNANKLVLKNCIFEEVDLVVIAQLVGASNATEVKITDNNKRKNINLQKINMRGFSRISKLDISDNYLVSLNEDSLEYVPNLKSLILRSNNIKSIPKNFFQFTPNLTSIELGGNKIERFEDGTFRNLKKLQILQIWTNELRELNNNVFDDLDSLIILNLRKNKLTIIPEGIFDKVTNLETVTLGLNLFPTLPEGLFKNNKKLKKLYLPMERKLTTLPSGLFNNLRNLSFVDLQGSVLNSLPENLFQGLVNLKTINLNNNNLTTLPGNIFNNLYNLTHLQLKNNKIVNLPEEIFKSCNNLKELYLDNNKIITITNTLFNNLVSLEKLFIKNNNITIIYKHAMKQLINIKEIDLSHNNITDLQLASITALTKSDFNLISIFNSLDKLEKLNLSHNKISNLYSDWNSYIGSKFQYLDLSHNAITHLSTDDIDIKNQKDFTLDLSHNSIKDVFLKHLERRFLMEKRFKISINIENNPVQCSCLIYDFLRYLDRSIKAEVREKLTIKTGPMKCSGPREFEGVFLSNLKSKDYMCIPPNDILDNPAMCPDMCDKRLRLVDKTLHFNCSYRSLYQAPETLCSLQMTNNSNKLDLTGNFIKNVPNFEQPGYDNLSTLILSHNQISTISKDIFDRTRLKRLLLDNNKLTSLPSQVTDEAYVFNKNITLGNNPWKCDCETRGLYNFIIGRSYFIEDVINIFCEESKIPLNQLTADEFCPSEMGWIITVCLSLALLVTCISVLAALYYRYQMGIKIWLYSKNICLWFVNEEELDKDKIYDAFVSYSHHDEDFVINELMMKLENGPRSFKLCLHFRDWLAGEWIPTQIVKSIDSSKRTIVVLSSNFIKSEWGKLEFRAAHKEALDEGRARVIVILYGDIGSVDKLDPELQSYMKMNTYIKWGDPWFWDKLRYALPHKSDVTFKNSKSKVLRRLHGINRPELNKSEVKIPLESNLNSVQENLKNLQNGSTIIGMGDDSKEITTIC